jgi:hypothetical protein
MENHTQLSGTMALLLLFILTNHAQACYYEGDPVWTGSAYDVPEPASDNNCYYSGDPVLIAAGQYDNPILLADNSYYTSDEQEASTQAGESRSDSEFSAFEDQDEPAESTQLNNQKNNNTQTNGKNNKNWTPDSWDLNY